MTGYAGAGLQVVEHQVVRAGGVGAVGAGAGTGAAVPAPAPGQAGVPLLVVGADTPALKWQELHTTKQPQVMLSTPLVGVEKQWQRQR